MYDSFDLEGGATKWFPWEAEPGTWCRFSEPASTFVRMGLSRRSGDRYSSQREFQFVDVTGLTPGPYTLRAQANPDGHVIEADPTDDVHEEQRIVPGVIASPASLTVAGATGAVDVTAHAVAPEIPARRSASCTPRATLDVCYSRITAASPLTYAVVSAPAHGAASFDGARLTYVPAARLSEVCPTRPPLPSSEGNGPGSSVRRRPRRSSRAGVTICALARRPARASRCLARPWVPRGGLGGLRATERQ